MSVTIPPERFGLLFPFHLVCDADLVVQHTGRSLRRTCPALVPGEALNAHFTPLASPGPIRPDDLAGEPRRLQLLRHRTSPLILRMQVLVFEEPRRFVFLGSPWLRSASDLTALGLTFSDFAVHDASVDLLQVVQTAIASLDDAREATARLTEQRAQLRDANDALQASQSRFRRLTDTITDLVSIVDLDNRYVYVSPSCRTILGFEPEHLLDRTPDEFFHPDDLHILRDIRARRTEAPRTEQTDYRFRTASGDYRWLEAASSPVLDDDGTMVQVLVVSRDISRRKAAEEALAASRDRLQKQAEDLARANEELAVSARMKDQFFANMSHELRTPLAAMIGLSESLRGGVYGSVSPGQDRIIGTIEESGNHLLEMINDILDLAKLEAGTLTITPGPCDAGEILQASISMVRSQAAKKEQSIRRLLPSAPIRFEADGRRIRQALVNLLSNAVKFTPPGGTIEMRVDTDAEAGEVRFHVEDTGVGIPEADLPSLFRPFTQLSSGLAKSHEGAGLGLALSQRLVRMHGGRIGVTSTPGQGSCFTVTLPWTPPR